MRSLGERERHPLSSSTLILSVLDCTLKRKKKKSVLFTSLHKVIISQAGNARGTFTGFVAQAGIEMLRDLPILGCFFFFQVSGTFKANRGARRL